MSDTDKELNNKDVLPFSEAPQNAFLGFLIIDRNFFLFCKDKIEPKLFVQTLNAKVYEALLGYHRKFSEFPSIENLLEWPSIATEDNIIKKRIETQIKIAIATTANYSIKWVSERLTEWLQVSAFSSSMERAAFLYNKGNFKEAFDVARAGIRHVDTIIIDPNKEYDPGNWQADFQESKAELEDALSFGNSTVDKMLNPMAKKGSLLKGDTTVLLAPTNIGKTTCLITIMCHNLLNGKDVLVLTHEGRAGDLRDKIWMNLLGMNRDQLYNYVAGAGSDPEVHNTIKALTDFLRERLCWIPMHKAGLTIEEVDAVIRQKIDEKRQRTGTGFDMIVDDYPAILTTARNAMGKLEMRHEGQIIYGYFVQLALEFKMHSLLAIQSNREGSKVNRGQGKETRLLTPEDVAEAFGPIQTATNVITINRDPVSMAKKLITYLIVKSRSSETGIAVVCREDFSKAITHSDDLGATWYRGASRMTDSDRIDDFIAQFSGRELPASAILGEESEDVK